MKHEYEAKFLAIDVAALQAKLIGLSAAQAFPVLFSPARSSKTAPSKGGLGASA